MPKNELYHQPTPTTIDNLHNDLFNAESEDDILQSLSDFMGIDKQDSDYIMACERMGKKTNHTEEEVIAFTVHSLEYFCYRFKDYEAEDMDHFIESYQSTLDTIGMFLKKR